MAASQGSKASVPLFEPDNFNGWVRLFRAFLMRYDELDKILDSSSSSEDEQNMDEAEQRAYSKKKRIKKANMGKVYSYMMEAAASNTTSKSIATSASMEIGKPKVLLKALEERFAVKRALTYQQSLKSFLNMTATELETGAQFVDRLKQKVSELCYFPDEQNPSESMILAILTQGIKTKYPILYSNLIVSATKLNEAYELISNYSNSGGSSTKNEEEKKQSLVVLPEEDKQAVAHFIAENKKLKKNLKRLKKSFSNKNKRQRGEGEYSRESAKDIECFKCHKKGHKKFECPLNRKGAENKKKQTPSWANLAEEEEVDMIFEEELHYVEVKELNNPVMIDSGANRIVIRDQSRISNLQKTVSNMNIAGKGMGLIVQGTGNIGFFSNVKWCPQARCDLISVAAINNALNCRTVLDDKDGVAVKVISNADDSVLFSGGVKQNDLYYIDFNCLEKLSVINNHKYDSCYYGEDLKELNNFSSSDKLILLHNRTGHLNYGTLKECIRNNLLLNTGLNSKDIRISKDYLKAKSMCDICSRAKGTRKSFKANHPIRGKQFGDFVSVDLVSYSVTTIEGYNYVLTFTDHASKWSKSYPLSVRNSDAILSSLRDYVITELKPQGVRLKHYHADGGKELISKLIIDELRSMGTTYSWTPPDTPELNAISERKFRTLFERALAMCLRASLPVILWWKAFETAEYLSNRLPTKTAKGFISPEEFITGQAPDASYWRTWGCKAYATIPRSYQRKDFTSKVMSGFHVGYSRTPIGYKVFVPELNDIITTVHVTFNEVIPDYTAEYYQELSKLNIQEEENQRKLRTLLI